VFHCSLPHVDTWHGSEVIAFWNSASRMFRDPYFKNKRAYNCSAWIKNCQQQHANIIDFMCSASRINSLGVSISNIETVRSSGTMWKGKMLISMSSSTLVLCGTPLSVSVWEFQNGVPPCSGHKRKNGREAKAFLLSMGQFFDIWWPFWPTVGYWIYSTSISIQNSVLYSELKYILPNSESWSMSLNSQNSYGEFTQAEVWDFWKFLWWLYMRQQCTQFLLFALANHSVLFKQDI